jgi:hypothetical protein
MSLLESQRKSEAFVHEAPKHAANDPYAFAEIQVCAYFKAERRNFEPGHELDDWLEAEKELAG